MLRKKEGVLSHTTKGTALVFVWNNQGKNGQTLRNSSMVYKLHYEIIEFKVDC